LFLLEKFRSFLIAARTGCKLKQSFLLLQKLKWNWFIQSLFKNYF